MKRLKSSVQAVVVLIFLLSNRATAADDDSNLIISNDNDDQQKANKNVNNIDLEELNPKENNCRLEKSPITTVKCSRIPLFCRSVCEQTRRLSLDSSLKRISSFSFDAYKVTDTSLDISFSNDLTRIDTDAFNGMVVAEDATVTINIGESPKSYDEQATVSNDSDEQDNDDEDENSSSQIEYDMPTPSTKPDETVLAGSAKLPPSRMSLKTLYVAPNAFRGLLVKESARLVVNVNGYDKIEFGPQSLVNMKQMSASVFSFVVGQSGLVVFQSRCAESWRPYNNDYLDPSGNDYDASN